MNNEIGPGVKYTLFATNKQQVDLIYTGKPFAEITFFEFDADGVNIDQDTFRVDIDDLLRGVDVINLARKHEEARKNPRGGLVPNGGQ